MLPLEVMEMRAVEAAAAIRVVSNRPLSTKVALEILSLCSRGLLQAPLRTHAIRAN